jgi:hypothetical protein
VLAYFGGNDPDDDQIFPGYGVYKGHRVTSNVTCGVVEEDCYVPKPNVTFVHKIKMRLSRYSVLYNITRTWGNAETIIRRTFVFIFPDSWLVKLGIIHIPRPNEQGIAEDKTYSAHLTQVRHFKELAEKNNTKLVVVLIPGKQDTRAADISTTSPNNRLKSFLDKENIAYLDLLPEFRRTEKLPDHPLYWGFDGHWNPEGNHLAGIAISKYLIQQGFISMSE